MFQGSGQVFTTLGTCIAERLHIFQFINSVQDSSIGPILRTRRKVSSLGNRTANQHTGWVQEQSAPTKELEVRELARGWSLRNLWYVSLSTLGHLVVMSITPSQAIILNLGLSPNWQTIDLTTMVFPAIMLVDYVRVYQRSGSTNIGCNPPDYPTMDYINNHQAAYTSTHPCTDRNLTRTNVLPS